MTKVANVNSLLKKVDRLNEYIKQGYTVNIVKQNQSTLINTYNPAHNLVSTSTTYQNNLEHIIDLTFLTK